MMIETGLSNDVSGDLWKGRTEIIVGRDGNTLLPGTSIEFNGKFFQLESIDTGFTINQFCETEDEQKEWKVGDTVYMVAMNWSEKNPLSISNRLNVKCKYSHEKRGFYTKDESRILATATVIKLPTETSNPVYSDITLYGENPNTLYCNSVHII